MNIGYIGFYLMLKIVITIDSNGKTKFEKWNLDFYKKVLFFHNKKCKIYIGF